MISEFYSLLEKRLEGVPPSLIRVDELGYVLLLCEGEIRRITPEIRNGKMSIDTVRVLESIMFGRLIYAAGMGTVNRADIPQILEQFVFPAVLVDGVSLAEWRRRLGKEGSAGPW